MPEQQSPEPGCYVDSHWGQYAAARAIEVAVDNGWHDDEATDLAARHLASAGPSSEPGLNDDEFERMMEACSDAENWLNDHHAAEGYAWGWNDGDFGFYALEDEGEVGW
jgi:hypothetical protein